MAESETTSDMAAKVAQSVTGTNTPDNVTVKRPVKQAVWTLFLALIVIDIGVAAALAVLAYGPWWTANPALVPSDTVQLARIKGISWIGWLLCGDIVLIAFAICTPWVGQITASAGNNKIEMGARND